MRRFILKAIYFYQRTGGSRRWFGISCNFSPTCSEYTRQAIEQCGVRRGVALGWRRIRACRHSDSFCTCYDPFIAEHTHTGSFATSKQKDTADAD